MSTYGSSYSARRTTLRSASPRGGDSVPMSMPAVSMLGVSMRATRMNYRRNYSHDDQQDVWQDNIQQDEAQQSDSLYRQDRRRASSRRAGDASRGHSRDARREAHPSSSASSSHLTLVEKRRGTTSKRSSRNQRVETNEREALQDEVVSRPAVYTQETPAGDGILSRLKTLRSSSTTARTSSGRGEARAQRASVPARGLHAPSWPVLLLVAITIALGVVILMGPARMYYAAWRDEGILEAQYAVVSAQYDDLNHDIERLQTLEGIEDLARRRGYAYPDEEALVVRELEEQEFVGSVSLEDAIEEHEKSLPWYVGVLDAFFDYHYE